MDAVEELIKPAPAVREGWRRAIGFQLFLLTTILLLIRPTELLGVREAVPLYEMCIIASLIFSAPEVIEQFSLRSLRATPIAVCVVLLIAAAAFSHLSHFRVGQALRSGVVVLRVVLYFVLVLACVRTPARLQRFIRLLAWLILLVAILSLLGFHQVLTAAVDPMAQPYTDGWGNQTIVYRLRGPGIFHDPNDMSLILVPAMMLWLHRILSPRKHWAALIVPLIAIFICLNALILTRSRGGFIVLVAAIMAFMIAQLGARRMLPWVLLVMPILLVLFAGRQTNIDLTDTDDTAQSRIQLWSEGLGMFRRAPLIGVGQGTYADEAGYVAHNSFVHSYAELGFFGGTLFLGAWYLAIRGLRRIDLSSVYDPYFVTLRPCLLGSVCGYAAGLLSLSRSYVVPTYLMLALAAVYLRMAPADALSDMRTTPRLIGRLIVASAGAVVVIYLFVRITARWS
jgi:O-antigen ligase